MQGERSRSQRGRARHLDGSEDSLGFVAFVRFLGQPQAGQWRSVPKSANLFLGPKRISPFYVTAL